MSFLVFNALRLSASMIVGERRAQQFAIKIWELKSGGLPFGSLYLKPFLKRVA